MSSGYPGDFTKEEEIDTVLVSRTYAVLLGAGAGQRSLMATVKAGESHYCETSRLIPERPGSTARSSTGRAG
jgi:hypothetical protein